MYQPTEVLPVQMELGECPLWDHRKNRLYWVDIMRCTLFELDWISRAMRTWPLPALGGGLALLGGDEILVAAQTGLFRFSPASGQYLYLLHPETGMPANRLNEGKADPAGNFWIGSMSTLGRRPEGSLYRVSPSGEISRTLSGIHVPNALVFLPGHEVIFTDSHLKVIWRYHLDPQSGEPTGREMFVDDTGLESIPDGAVADSDGNIWNAKFGGGRIAVYDPDGRRLHELALPATQVTSCAFCGPDLDYLAVTTAKRLLDDEQRRSQTEAGNLFIFRSGVSGLREPVSLI
ncbi:SMP-30/gluconolactonase/LRE family protein [Mesorhizobium sp.]|uniref:SMP-30/gluconolactonase/LRE family protein n=1 Tax=Mesorhizobium sp. TaxID=1871066 RepID=UPI000FE36434|nr:SMP-30/gluconolactonase/LRE family protein [Mesorhizobium sp.]RWH67375.1 MAG: SMP-30/gluconolactonase/LRE family protein [Mesorhizobium sp.]RWL23294.1 MAG: SMP-30/gluconolactonase/LRE family protein [Mesorhizobium sp.]RWL25903.1 MAG: SMP-30/gluconolactonase/LRE family protein [Mesorhizobium sp.]RWL32786.1 MAG: SMP-30/gluconolactonase/LRE family protein [Mesorhizobium sp.]RWL52262.1 MAG: SMP-30/gluconolactonase/LRE family protein [Mesorhizobium sp.]